MDKDKTINLFPGVNLTYIESIKKHRFCSHEKDFNVIEINYCHKGSLGWELNDNSSIYLSAGDFSLNTRGICPDTTMNFPNSYYRGLEITVDIPIFKKSIPNIIEPGELNPQIIEEKFCKRLSYSIIGENPISQAVFQGFYDKNLSKKLSFLRLKILELLIFLENADPKIGQKTSRYESEQIETIKRVHDYICENLDKKITIDSLAKMFFINSTSLKKLFKDIYGNSLASHIKEHRMEKAEKLLTETAIPIADIAKEVGYKSQSKFIQAFKEEFKKPPLAYRKEFIE